MKFHPLQTHQESIDMLSEIFHARMKMKEILPNPFELLSASSKKMERLEEWLASMGGKCHDTPYIVLKAGCGMFKVRCSPPATRDATGLRRRWGKSYVYIEIPWDVADKVLTLGYIP